MNSDNQKLVLREDFSLMVEISDIINCMVILLDWAGSIIRYNEVCSKISGVDLSEAKGKYFWEVFCDPDEVELYKAFFSEIDQDNLPVKVENQMIHRDGSLREIVWEYNILEKNYKEAAIFVLTGYDVTEHNKYIKDIQEIKELYRTLVHTLPVAVISVDTGLRIKSWSSAAENLLGWSEKEVLDREVVNFLDQSDQLITRCSKKVIEGNSFYKLEHSCLHKQKSEIVLELSISPLRNNCGEVSGLVLVASDITARKGNEEKLKYLSMRDQLTGLYNRPYFDDMLNSMNTESSYPVTIIVADLDGLKLINDTLGHEHGDKMLLDCADIFKNNLYSEDLLARIGGDEFVVILPQTDRITGESVVKRIKNSFYNYNLSNNSLPLSMSIGLATAEDKRTSLMELYREADDLVYLDKMQTGAGAKSQIIDSFMVALDERDFITGGHARRLEEKCKEIGHKLNLSPKKFSRLMLLAKVHDLGKVGIPDHILYKKGSLNEDEWKIMRKHTEKGHRIASASSDLQGIADLILKHHERWDGKGYPLGLKGFEIPIECRILAVVDAFDAMTSERPYKKPKSEKRALEELKKFTCLSGWFSGYVK